MDKEKAGLTVTWTRPVRDQIFRLARSGFLLREPVRVRGVNSSYHARGRPASGGKVPVEMTNSGL